jgi:glycosyltransferase involved in cell wall biosynthesis
MRIVLISYHFPPARAVGGLRAAKDAEALRAAGHEVHVIAARVPEADAPQAFLPSGVLVERVRPWPSPRQLWVRWRHWQRARTEGESAPDAAPPLAHPGGAMPPTWKRFVTSLFWLPDDLQGFIVPAARAARRTFPGGPDLLISTAPPFSAHLAGLLLARSGTRWIAEFRDPWTDNPIKTAIYRSGLSDRMERWMERCTLRGAQRIVAASEGIHRLLQGKLPAAERDRVILVRNGIDWLAPPEPTRRATGPRRIVYAGVFYMGRDPRLFLTALARVIQAARLTPDDVQVHLVGQCRSFNGISIEQETARLGLEPFVRFEDWLPHEATQELVRCADVLLLLAQGQPDQVPNKLYEYLGTRRPILAFVDEGGEAARMLRETGGHVLVTSDSLDEAVHAVRRSLGLGPEPVAMPDARVLENWTTRTQMRRLIEAIGT